MIELLFSAAPCVAREVTFAGAAAIAAEVTAFAVGVTAFAAGVTAVAA